MSAEKRLRFEEQRDYFERALARFREVLTENESDIVRDSIIQRFEFTFEMAWKSMFYYLESKGESVAKKAFAVLPEAFAARLIDDAEAWDNLRDYRNDTSHEYNQQRAIEIVAFVRGSGLTAFEKLLTVLARAE